MSLTIDELRWLHFSRTMDLLPTVRTILSNSLYTMLSVRAISLPGRMRRC